MRFSRGAAREDEQQASRGQIVVAAGAGAVLTVIVLAVVAAATGLHLARVHVIDVYVTAVNSDRSDIGYARTAGGDVKGTYDLRGLEAWADGANGAWLPVEAQGVLRSAPWRGSAAGGRAAGCAGRTTT